MIRLLPLLLCLAACSSGGGGDAGGDRLGAFTTLHTRIASGDITPAAQLPDGGTVSYAGLVRLDLPLGAAPAAAFIGDIDLTVDFSGSAPPVLGTISHLQANGGPMLGGTLDISDGAVQPDADPDTDFQLSATVSGTLSTGGTDYMIDGSLAGDFYGRTGDAVAGVVFGDIATEGAVDVFDGAFAAESPP